MLLPKILQLRFWESLISLGLLGIGGSKSKEESKSTSKLERIQTETSTGQKDTTSTLSQEDLKTISSLDDQTKELLTGFLTTLTENAASTEEQDRIGGILDILQERALTTEADINAQTGALVDEARRQGEKQLGQQVTSLAQATGSSQNSLVQQSATEGAQDLETRLAALGSEFALKARESETDDLNQLIQAIGSGAQAEGQNVSSIAAIANILKGASVTSAGTSTQAGASSETAETSRKAIENAVTESRSKGSSKRLGFELKL